MSFIKICPESAKMVDFYGTRPDWREKVAKGKWIEIPLYSLKDGTEYSDNPTRVQFPRIGEYEVKTSVLCSEAKFDCRWESDRHFRTISFSWKENKESKVGICTERVLNFFPYSESGIKFGARMTSDVNFDAIIVTVEHLES